MPNKMLLKILEISFKAALFFDKQEDTPFDAKEVKNVLIVNTTAIGDTLLSTPAIRAVRKGFPDANISILASPAARLVIKNNPNVDEIIAHPGKVDLSYFLRLPCLLYRVRRRRFDLVVILHANDPDAAPLAYLSGARHRMGWAESRLAFLHTIPVKTKGLPQHIIDTRLNNLKEIGIVSSDRRMELFLSNDEKAWAKGFIKKAGFSDKTLIGVHPFGSKVNKWWPVENVIEFCKEAIKEFSCRVIIFGGKKEINYGDEISQAVKGVVNLAGKLTIRESASLINECRVFISTDSGPMHIALSLGVPTVALFGPDNPLITGPLIKPYAVIQKNIPCVPCELKVCERNMECMKEIRPGKVIDCIREMLKISSKDEVLEIV